MQAFLISNSSIRTVSWYVTFTCQCAGGYPKVCGTQRLYFECFQMKIYWAEKVRVERALSLSSASILAEIMHTPSHVVWIKVYGALIFLPPLRFSSTLNLKRMWVVSNSVWHMVNCTYRKYTKLALLCFFPL